MKNKLRSVNGSDKQWQTTQLWQRGKGHFVCSAMCWGTYNLLELASQIGQWANLTEHVISVKQRTDGDQTDPALMQ